MESHVTQKDLAAEVPQAARLVTEEELLLIGGAGPSPSEACW